MDSSPFSMLATHRPRRHMNPARSRSLTSLFGSGDEEIHAQFLRQELRNEPSFHTVSSLIQRRGKSSQSTLPRRDGDDSSADTAVTWLTDVAEPITRSLIHTGGRHSRPARNGKCSRQPGCSLVSGLTSHDRYPSALNERTLLDVEVGCFDRVPLDAVVTLSPTANVATGTNHADTTLSTLASTGCTCELSSSALDSYRACASLPRVVTF